jgi:outer membrane protein TolC
MRWLVEAALRLRIAVVAAAVLLVAGGLQFQRSAETVQQSVTWRQLQLRAELEAEAAFDRYKVALHSLESQPIDVGAALPPELQALERQFRAGEVDVVRAIQARTSILQSRAAQLNLMNEVAQSAALLVGATGMPFEFIMTQLP